MMRRSLAGAYRILEAGDGMDAIRVMRDIEPDTGSFGGGTGLAESREPDGRIDCIVSDINMRPMNGLEFVRTIRAGGAAVSRDIPVIMLTSHTEKHLLATSIALDTNGYLIKPSSAKAVIERIEQVAGMPGPVKPESDYAALAIPELGASDLWSVSVALSHAMPPVSAADLAGGRVVRVKPSELKIDDRLAENLCTEDGVLVVPGLSRVTPALIAAIRDLSQHVTLQAQVAVFHG
jgi:CheY-like chemotaxis protein